MALRIKTKWHRSKRKHRSSKQTHLQDKSLHNVASVIAINLWKIAQNSFKHMEQEGFRFAKDKQVIDVLSEWVAFSVHIADRMIYGCLNDSERAEVITDVSQLMADNMVSNQLDLLGPGEYKRQFITQLNKRFAVYSECAFDDYTPSFEMQRYLAHKISEIMTESDDKWVLEQVMDIEIPNALDPIKTTIMGVLKGCAKKID